MSPEGRSIFRMTGIGLVILALVLLGVVIGVNLGPRAVTVEQKVIAPMRAATSGRRNEDLIADMIEAACPAIVAIRQSHVAAPAAPAGHGKRRKPASVPQPAGFLVSADGYVLTAASVLSSSGGIQILLQDGRTLDATRAGSDPLSGIALLKVEADGLPFLAFSDAGFPRIGQSGISLESPNATGCWAVSAMVGSDFLVSGEGLRAWFRVTPALDSYFAATPMLDRDGHVIGIAGLAPSESADGTDLLPAATAERVASELMRGGAAVDNGFGLDTEDLVPALAARIGADRQRGAMVSLISPHSPADAAGLMAGDVIFAAGGQPVSGASELARALDTDAKAITLDVLRRGQGLKLELRKG